MLLGLDLFQSRLFLDLLEKLIGYLFVARNLREMNSVCPVLMVRSASGPKAASPEKIGHLFPLDHRAPFVIDILTQFIGIINRRLNSINAYKSTKSSPFTRTRRKASHM